MPDSMRLSAKEQSISEMGVTTLSASALMPCERSVAVDFFDFFSAGLPTKVFQALQNVHCPCHLANSLPHSEQKNTDLSAIMSLLERQDLGVRGYPKS
jgi:hypothetical protein